MCSSSQWNLQQSTQTLKMGKKGDKSLFQMFIEDFEVQNWKLLEKTKLEILPKSGNIFQLYCFDYIFCHLIIGNARVFLFSSWYYSFYPKGRVLLPSGAVPGTIATSGWTRSSVLVTSH